ncbi:NADP-dependent alcohol dehydrogenase [Leptodontidium sp. 2 PMI_412]|nr:NADP-dependent alcohol dehydrogenase [Leptodontidium sp. 2 PMI_412]
MSAYKFKVFRGDPATGDIIEAVTERPALINDQVLISITHSGLCGTDEHFLKSGIALGHEGVGVVKELGPEVKHLKVGDRVAWGYVNGSCGSCTPCLEGYQIACETHQIYGFSSTDSGSFGELSVRSEAYLSIVPDELSSAAAAPLMCGGITVWAALMNSVKPNDTVGVVGIGGLGHLATQFAKAMGNEVVVFSSTESKRDEAVKLGATHFVATKGKTELSIPKKINHLLITASVNPDWSLFYPIMAPGATLYPLTVVDPKATLDIPQMGSMFNRIRVAFTMPKKSEYKDMLQFAARNGIAPVVDRDEMTKEGVARSMEKLRLGKTRYRGVLFASEED